MKAYVPSKATTNQTANNFFYHSPREDQAERYTYIREQVKHLAETFTIYAPASRELSLALTKLEEAMMWVNAAIARNE